MSTRWGPVALLTAARDVLTTHLPAYIAEQKSDHSLFDGVQLTPTVIIGDEMPTTWDTPLVMVTIDNTGIVEHVTTAGPALATDLYLCESTLSAEVIHTGSDVDADDWQTMYLSRLALAHAVLRTWEARLDPHWAGDNGDPFATDGWVIHVTPREMTPELLVDTAEESGVWFEGYRVSVIVRYLTDKIVG